MHHDKKRTMVKIGFVATAVFFLSAPTAILSGQQDLLQNLGRQQDYTSKRISSFDRTGGNNDRLSIPPGETAVLAEIQGPAAIHHIWVTISAEAFYGRKIVLRMYWDGERSPSVEVPIGDFFGMGHGLNRNLSSLPISCSSEGRARNCYWFMPFMRSARITATNEGSHPVGAFYYYIDYRELSELSEDIPYFHAQYRQEMPCLAGKNYLILDASGRGHFVGCNLSILQRAMGWWGEGDDMIYVDGEEFPSLHGTGSEDYFSDAWGMREDENLFYGCPLQEPDFQVGSKATVYRFHIPDPIPFKKSIRMTIEHGHDNDRSDFYSSVAYWYQSEPHRSFPALPSAAERLPYAQESSGDFIFPEWERIEETGVLGYRDINSGMAFRAPGLSLSFSSFYDQAGDRYPLLTTENAGLETTAELSFLAETGELYDIDLYFMKGPDMGQVKATEIRSDRGATKLQAGTFDGYSSERKIDKLTLHNIRLDEGTNTLVLRVTGKASKARGSDLSLVSMGLSPSDRRFITEWNLIGPFDAPDMSYLQTAYPPEEEIDMSRAYEGKGGNRVGWKKMKAEPSGFMRLENRITPSERGIVYGLVYVYSSDKRKSLMLVGSDDGVRVWLNDTQVHTNPAYRGAYPDQDRISVTLNEGWNKLLIKVLQGGGGWGYYVRFVDPEGQIRWSTERR